MIKTILVFPDGTEISSGADHRNAIIMASIEESVNDAEDLTFGAVCAKIIGVNIITPYNEFRCEANDEIIVYQENEKGIRQKKGVFIAQKPERVNANTTKISGYDRIIKFDIDISDWLNALDAFPYTLYDFASMVCDKCGVQLVTESIPNGNLLVQKFQASGVTGRQVMSWICEAAGSFCVANADGDAEISWYSENSVPIVADRREGAVTFFGGGLSYEDYTISAIDGVQIKKDSKDVGVTFPSDTAGKNVYIIENNPLISAIDLAAVSPVAEVLYNRLKDVSYTPCKVSFMSSLDFSVGDIVSITDRNGKTISAYVMSKTRRGQKDEIICNGNFKRNGTNAVYNTSYKSLFGKTLSIEKSIDGLTVTAEEAGKKISKLEQTAGQVSVEVQDESGKISSIINPNEITIAKKDAEGNMVSGFYYDANAGEFKFYGSGEFRSSGSDGSYIRVENDEIIMYARNNLDKFRIGFVSSETGDFPYMILGNELLEGYVGLVKRFSNGVWFGNSAPKNDTGSFSGRVGASGIFVNTDENKAYIVAGTEMQNLYTGEAIARFA